MKPAAPFHSAFKEKLQQDTEKLGSYGMKQALQAIKTVTKIYAKHKIAIPNLAKDKPRKYIRKFLSRKKNKDLSSRFETPKRGRSTNKAFEDLLKKKMLSVEKRS